MRGKPSPAPPETPSKNARKRPRCHTKRGEGMFVPSPRFLNNLEPSIGMWSKEVTDAPSNKHSPKRHHG